MNMTVEVRWRLRDGDHIVGFERHVEGRVWSSPDGFWWRGARLDYSDKDRCFGVKDVNNEWLFQGDVVTWHPHSGSIRGQVLRTSLTVMSCVVRSNSYTRA